jgi:hypothetical protein
MRRRPGALCRPLPLTILLILSWAVLGPDRALADSAGPADKPDAAVLERIREASCGIRSIESRFVQESRSAMLEEPLRSSGRFRYEAPDRLLWEVVSPERFGFSLDGERVRTWRGTGEAREGAPPGAEEGIRRFAEQLFAWVRADFAWLEERFEVTVEGRSPAVVSLEPRSPEAAERLDRIRVTFAGDLNHAEAIEILERGGDRTVISFEETRVVKGECR